MAKKKSEPEVKTSDYTTKYEGFVNVKIHRSQIKNAEYNPRVITPQAKKALKRSLEKNKLVAPITWNKQTGNIVGGHQRVDSIDALEGTADYSMTVAMIDVSLKREKEINAALNNKKIQGEFDPDKFLDLLKTPDLDMEAVGLSDIDRFRLFGNDPNQLNAETLIHADEELKGINARIKRLAKRDDGDFYLVLVGRDSAQVTKFLELLSLDNNRFQPLSFFAEQMGLSLDDD